MEVILSHVGRRHARGPVVRERPSGVGVVMRAAPFRCWALVWAYLGVLALPALVAMAGGHSPGLWLAPLGLAFALLGLAGPVLPGLAHFGAERVVVDGRSVTVRRAGLRRRLGLDHIVRVELLTSQHSRVRLYLRDGTHLDLGRQRSREHLVPLVEILQGAVARRREGLDREGVPGGGTAPEALERLRLRA